MTADEATTDLVDPELVGPELVGPDPGGRDLVGPEPGPVDTTAPGPWCPLEVRRPCMVHRWDNLTFLHWRFAPAVVQRLLPSGLEIETFRGAAWVGLVPFEMEVRPPGTPAAPWMSHFPETNVRTYVRATDGTSGVWFLSLDAARLAAVITARSGFDLPYYWSKMAVTTVGSIVSYQSRRRWPGPTGARCEVAVEVGDRFAPQELTDLEHWLTARWRLYSVAGRRRRYALAEHEPWPLHEARVLHLRCDLLAAAGLPAPEGPPLVHWSPGVEVRIGVPHRLVGRP
jgi:uncharacterized protein YqjF (DUF2071 family)